MFCGQCGKRVLETMLFCPFCGAPIVIPDQDDAPEPAAQPAEGARIAAAEAQAMRQPDPAPEDIAPSPDARAATAEEAPADSDAGDQPTPEDDIPDAIEPIQPEEPPAQADAPEADEEEPPREEVFEPLHLDELPPMPAQPQPDDAQPERPRSLFDDHPEEGEAPSSGDAQAERPSPPEPERRPAPQPRQPSKGEAAARAARSFIPVRDVDVNDMFMNSSHPSKEAGRDPYDGEDEGFEDDFDYEEPEEGSFLQRHIRGLVGLVLLLMLLVVFLIWAVLPQGQRTLAPMNLAWKASIYDDMGHEAYDAGLYDQAATYFERALARDGSNYEYAHSAMVAHFEAGNEEDALNMLYRCIEMNPDSPEPYHELMILYPDPATRPWEVSEKIRLGYERTGDESLNLGGE